jgi:anion-transporting  ArsA/GET3 family ATPase
MTSEGRASQRIPVSRKVILCMGPGGVGKTTVSAALALAAAAGGRRVIVVTIDPSRRLAQALGLDPDGEPGRVVAVEAPHGGKLDCLLLDPQSVFDSIVEGYSKTEGDADTIRSNPIYRATAQHLSGAVEYAAIVRVQMLATADDYDLVVLDTPPTANAVQFLDAPTRIREIVGNPAARLLAGTGRIGMKILGLGGGVLIKTLASMGGGGFLGELGSFLRQFGVVLAEFQRRAGDVEELLRSDRAAVVLTTAATDFTVREAEGFLGELRERGLAVDGIVVNRLLAPPPASPEDAAWRATLAEVAGTDFEPVARELEALASDAAQQGARGERIVEELRRSYHPVPVCALARRDPPPTSLAELAEMGRELVG